MGQNGSISVKQIMRAVKIPKYTVKMRETMVWNLSQGQTNVKMVLGRNTETWKMRNPCDVAGKLGSDQMGGG